MHWHSSKFNIMSKLNNSKVMYLTLYPAPAFEQWQVALCPLVEESVGWRHSFHHQLCSDDDDFHSSPYRGCFLLYPNHSSGQFLRAPPQGTIKIKKKVSALNSQILIKYKRIKWTPSCKATLLLPGG